MSSSILTSANDIDLHVRRLAIGAKKSCHIDQVAFLNDAKCITEQRWTSYNEHASSPNRLLTLTIDPVVGDFFSFSVGDSIASGGNSQALGTTNVASGLNSIAFGLENNATNANCVAIGRNNTVAGNDSLGIGRAIISGGLESVCLGVGANDGNFSNCFIAGGHTATEDKELSFSNDPLLNPVIVNGGGTALSAQPDIWGKITLEGVKYWMPLWTR